MHNPIISFGSAIFIWLSLIGVVAIVAKNDTQILSPHIAIEAEMFGEIVEKKQAPRLAKDVTPQAHDDKISDLKKSSNQKEIQHHDHHYEDEKPLKSQSPKILYRPLPQIPRNLRKEAFSTKARAKFYVQQDGTVKKIELAKPASNPRLNFLLMKELKKWKFEKSTQDFEVEVNVSFKVK